MSYLSVMSGGTDGTFRQAVRTDRDQLLRQRVRWLLWVGVCTILAIWVVAASGLFRSVGRALPLVNLVELGILCVALTQMNRPWVQRHILLVALALAAQVAIAIGVYGVITANFVILSIRVVTLALLTGVFLPWGAGPQSVIVATYTLSFAWVHWSTHQSIDHPTTLPTMVALVLSILVADWVKRSRVLLLREGMQRQEVDAALRRAHGELERRVRERTAALAEANRSLEEAKGDAEEANRAKDRFLANMSHEMRTPLNVIIGMTDILLDSEVDAERRHIGTRLRKAAENLSHLTNDLFDLSVARSGKLPLACVPFDLARLVDETTAIFSQQASAKGLHLRVDSALPALAVVRGDPGRIAQVLNNLLSNAVKFTDRGEVELHVARDGEESRGELIRFEVRDTGIGIPAGKREAIFESFTQVEDAGVESPAGVGLGLAICRQLVDLMGGEIGVDSSVGMGSTFWFRLPLPAAEPGKGKQDRLGGPAA